MYMIRVLCVTPRGLEGRGGIDRLYYYLRQFHDANGPADIELSYFAARGGAPGALWAVTFSWRIILFVTRMALMRPHIVHLNFSNGGSILRKYALMRIAKLFGAETIMHFHGQFTAEDVAGWSPRVFLLFSLCRHASRIIVLGNFYQRAFIELVGVPANKLVTIPNGIPDFAENIRLPKPAHAELRFVFLGEVGLRKGVDILLNALACLAQRTEAWTCVVAGNGDIARFQSLAHSLGLQGRVRFSNWVDADEVHRLARESDVVVLPSRAEALPLTLIEGACAGAALVASAVGEISEIVKFGVNGILIDIDPDELATALEHLIRDRDSLAHMQVASREIYRKRFRIQVFAAALRALYLELSAAPVSARTDLMQRFYFPNHQQRGHE
jgi:glycosyltransferase involved in cell wall biosynthesis